MAGCGGAASRSGHSTFSRPRSPPIFRGGAPGVVVKRCVLAAVGLTSRPWVQSPVEAGEGRVDRRRVWGARALPPSPLRDGRRENG